MTTHIGIVIFERFTQLDALGPFEVFARIPNATVHLVARSTAPVTSDTGLKVLPSTTFDDCPQLNVLCVPGGPGQAESMDDQTLLNCLAAQGQNADHITAVCTGSLLLGAAGLLQGKKATTHWAAHDLLALFGAIPTQGRVVNDGNITTGGGVTAGIDFALTLTAKLCGDMVAQAIQLGIEYDPAPPFNAGSPQSAPPDVLNFVTGMMSTRWASRLEKTQQAAQNLQTKP